MGQILFSHFKIATTLTVHCDYIAPAISVCFDRQCFYICYL